MRRGAELLRVGSRLRLRVAMFVGERSLDDLVGVPPEILLANERCDGAAEKPRRERAVEQLELVVSGDERLAQRKIDVLLAREVDCVEAAKSVEHPAGSDLDSHFPEHAAERDHVTDDGRPLH